MKIAVTGTIASGKTSVSILLKRMGMPVFNSDQYARMLYLKTHPAYTKMRETFGDGILDEEGEIDRKKVASLIFSDPKKRKELDDLTHPYIREGMYQFFDHVKVRPLIFAEVPLLFEAGWQDAFDAVWLVTCKKETAVERMMEDRSYTREEAEARYASQLDKTQFYDQVDEVIENDGSLTELNHTVNGLIRKYRERIRNGA